MPMKFLLILFIFSSTLSAAEDEAAAGGWTGEGALGFISTSGNTESENLNASLGIAKELELWKHSVSIEAIRSETDDVVSAESTELKGRSEYKFSEKSYAFGQLRYEEDEFSGYDSQTSLAFGAGSRFIENEQHLLDLSAGLGYRSLEDSVTNETEEDGIVTADLIYEYNISETAKFSQTLSIESGDENTHTESETALKTSIAGNFSSKISYLVKLNSDVPADTDKTDSILSVTLVYGF
jgi:putative salt-induced outer membrane protein